MASTTKRFGFDTVCMDGKVIGETEDTLTVSAVIAREMVQQYPEGMAYKPAEELEKAANGRIAPNGRFVVLMKHPDTGLVTRGDEIAGRLSNVRFARDIMDPKTKRPMVRGIRADVTWDKKFVTADMISRIKSGELRDVSIGFTYDEDRTPGEFNGERYDFAQRNIFIDHLAAPVPVGRCPSPYCGLGVDTLPLRKVAGDPWEETEQYIRSGHRNSADFDPDSLRTITISAEKGIKAVVGCPKGKYAEGKCSVGMEVQSYLFDAKKFTLAEAKAWFNDHKGDAMPGMDESNPCPILAAIREDPEAFTKRLKATFPDAELSKLLKPAEGSNPSVGGAPPPAAGSNPAGSEPAKAPEPAKAAAPEPPRPEDYSKILETSKKVRETYEKLSKA